MKNTGVFIWLCSLLSMACSPEKENSETLLISWDKLPGYCCYIFTPQAGAAFSVTGDFRAQEDTTELSYTWQGNDIGLHAIALPQRSVQLGMSPEVDDQGRLYIKRNGYAQPLAEHDLLIAGPRQIAVGKSKANLRFHYGMSLGTVALGLADGVDGYVFNIIGENLIQDGYVDLLQGTVVAGKEVNNLYFSQRGSSFVYDLPFVPQTVGVQMKISITGMRNIGIDKVLRYDLLVGNRDFQPARQYVWTFTVMSDEIIYKGFEDKERNL